MVHGVVQMKLEGYSKISLSSRQSARVCAYKLMYLITHPSESHIGIYTQTLQLVFPPLRRTVR